MESVFEFGNLKINKLRALQIAIKRLSESDSNELNIGLWLYGSKKDKYSKILVFAINCILTERGLNNGKI